MNITRKALFILVLLVCLLPGVDAALALVLGIAVGLANLNPWPVRTSSASRSLLKISVIGLGFGVPIGEVWHVGSHSVGVTIASIALALTLGLILGRVLGLRGRTAMLISCGTAICGGSAIAAVAPVLKARDDETAVALATVFSLNAVALMIFPAIGHLVHLSQHQFGIWAGLAIHDTSSVVGAAARYGEEALRTGTTVKLVRAMWIAPLALAIGLGNRSGGRFRVPLFIVGFVLAALVHSLLPGWSGLWGGLHVLARRSLVATLFLIGCGLTREVLSRVGVRPLLHGVSLWLAVGTLTLAALGRGVIG